ncbi:MAG TPA: tetratricopeptide repeat protein, partial [Pseudonocardiaceae bacterium]
GTPLVAAYVALERGRVLRSSGRAEAAGPLFRAALDIALGAGHEHLAADAAHMLAIIGDAAEQERWARRALEIAGASADPRARRWVGPVCNNLGWTLHEQGRHEEALDLWERALAAYIERGDPEAVRIARWTVARGLRELGRVQEALAIQEELATGPPDPYVDEELALLRGQGTTPGTAEP